TKTFLFSLIQKFFHFCFAGDLLVALDSPRSIKKIDDQQLGFLANFLGIFIFALVIAYHYVMADPKYEGN
ncbi:dolichyl-diphosphooligosaccharide--protein glycosyltransferase subunit 4A-like, partial [Hibiscus syriacus]|uniref:dolichyl-diphosphooligosaccharide--protein glycosyltransferase subunit 4A-like n=1 Tax=Hibiscus syriacus TaxID=106335 RepID=UPI0019207EB9